MWAPAVPAVAEAASGAGSSRLRLRRLQRPAHASARLVSAAAVWSALGKQHQQRMFVFGLGYSGLAAARYFQQRGWEVEGTCRTEEKCERLARKGITTYHFDPNEWDNLSGKALDSLRHATHVLSTVPPDSDSDVDPVIMWHAQLLSERAEHFRWVGYISSTSVYGDYGGEWVQEGSELRATAGKGWSRIMAEHEWLALHDTFGLPVHLFRCGGIYGPERSAIETVQRARLAGGDDRASAARRARQRYTARCHVHDICQTLEASMRHPRPGSAYNIADDDPADRATVMAYAAELLARQEAGLPPPGPEWGSATPPPTAAAAPEAAAAAVQPGAGTAVASLAEGALPMGPLSAGSSSASSGSYDSADEALPQQAAAGPPAGRPRGRYRGRQYGGGRTAEGGEPRQMDEKRVSNARIKQELGVKLAFPTYRQGLAAIAAGDRRPFEP